MGSGLPVRNSVSQRLVIRYAIVLVLFAATGSLQSCAKERSTTHVIPNSRVYVTLENPLPPTLLIFDANADSLVDSLRPPIDAYTTTVVCDRKYPRFLVSQNRNVFLFSGAGGSAAGPHMTRSVYFAYCSSTNEIIGSRGTYGGVVGPIVEIFDAETMTLAHEDTIALGTQVAVDQKKGLFYGISYYEDTPGATPSRSVLCAYDIVHRNFHDCWAIIDTASGTEYYLDRFAISPDGKNAYLQASVPSATRLIGLELETKKTFFEINEFAPRGEPEVTPDGRQVWLPVGGEGPSDKVDRIKVYDARTGDLQETIDLQELRFHPNATVNPYSIRFTPDGTRAYVLCLQFGGPILLIDTDSFEILKVWPTDESSPRIHRPLSIDIGPAP